MDLSLLLLLLLLLLILLLLLLLLLSLLLLSSLLDPNAKKCWLIIKPEREQAAREVFRDTAINVTTKNMLGRKKIVLADFAISQPQASYAAFTFSLRHRWTYFLRTSPDIANKAPDARLDIHARGFLGETEICIPRRSGVSP